MLNEWINWNGGDRPVPIETEVKTQMRDGSEGQDYAGRLRWDHVNFGGDILKYQVLITLHAARDRINKIKETVAKLDKERAELLEFIRSEGFVLIDEPSLIDTPVVEDMSDPKNWKAGDVLKCRVTSPYTTVARLYIIKYDGIDECGNILIVDNDRQERWRDSSHFKWYARPPK